MIGVSDPTVTRNDDIGLDLNDFVSEDACSNSCESDDEDIQSFLSSTSSPIRHSDESSLIIDSGNNHSVVNDGSLLCETKRRESAITVGSGEELKISHEYMLNAFHGDSQITLNNVLLCDNIVENLASVPQMTTNGSMVVMVGDKCVFYPSGHHPLLSEQK